VSKLLEIALETAAVVALKVFEALMNRAPSPEDVEAIVERMRKSFRARAQARLDARRANK
jgi:hypothetical protein